jgi:hypothetical protein
MIAPPNRDKTRYVISPRENGGIELPANHPDHLEPFLPIAQANGRKHKVVGIRENLIPEAKRQTVLRFVSGILRGIEAVIHGVLYGISVLASTN